MKLRIGLVGCGNISKKYVTILNKIKGIEVTASYDTVPSQSIEFSKNFSNCQPVETYDKLLERCNLIILCTPTSEHYPLAKIALFNQKHVFIEKPITIDTIQAKELVKLANKNNLAIQVNFQYRFSNVSKQAKNWVKKKIFGKIITSHVKINWRRDDRYYSGWRGKKSCAGGGIIINQAIHFIDLLCFLFGKPVKVLAKIQITRKGINVEDSACAILDFGKNGLATVTGTTATYPDEYGEIEIHGTKGSVIIDQINTGGRIKTQAFLKPKKLTVRSSKIKLANNKKSLEQFLQQIRSKTKNPENEIINTMKTVDALYKSAEIGKEVKV